MPTEVLYSRFADFLSQRASIRRFPKEMEYQGYLADVKYDDEAQAFHGEVLNIRDVVTFVGRSVDELQKAFHESVDDYLEYCRERGEEPEKPFSGKFVVRAPPELHRAASTAAARDGKSLNAWVVEQLSGSV